MLDAFAEGCARLDLADLKFLLCLVLVFGASIMVAAMLVIQAERSALRELEHYSRDNSRSKQP